MTRFPIAALPPSALLRAPKLMPFRSRGQTETGRVKKLQRLWNAFYGERFLRPYANLNLSLNTYHAGIHFAHDRSVYLAR